MAVKKKIKRTKSKSAGRKMSLDSMFMIRRPVKRGKRRINIFQYILVFLLIWSLFFLFAPASGTQDKRPISELISLARDGQVVKVEVSGDLVSATFKDSSVGTFKKETGTDFLKTLTENGVDPASIPEGVEFKDTVDYFNLIVNIAPIIITVGFFYWILKGTKGGAGDLLSFGKSRAKLFRRDPTGRNGVSFKDVAGAKEVKEDLTEIVDFLKNPGKYRRLGARIPKGVLLVGPAGVGKTLMARALAGEAGVPFYSVAGSEFMEMLVGIGSARVRDLFVKAKASQPSLIFIDEIDAIGRQRGMGIGGGHDEREQTLNQILVEMDGFDPRTTVVVVAATNRPDMLDPALVRPGRFDRKIYLSLPDIESREEIFRIHMRGKIVSKSVKVEDLARQTVGFSGADIENMLNEAAIFAAKNNKNEIEMSDLREAATKVKLGPERRRIQDENEKKITAYHEAGHAIVAHNLPNMDPVERVSIVARTMSLGHTEIAQKMERYNETKDRLLDFITMALGGRASEEEVFKSQTVGASDDIEKATEITKRMVTEFGMSSLGPINYSTREDKMWLARQLGKPVGYSQKTAAKVDKEVEKIINASYDRALKIIRENRKTLDKIASELIKKETLEKEEFEKLAGKPVSKS